MRILKILLLQFSIMFVASCSDKELDYIDGIFYFGGGDNILKSYNIANKSELEVDQMSRHNPKEMPADYTAPFFVEYVVDEENFLVTANHLDAMYIYKYNITSKSVEILRKGSRPVYMPKYNKIIFYEYDNIMDKSSLFVADINDNKSKKLIADYDISSLRSYIGRVMPISDDKILYHTYTYNDANNSGDYPFITTVNEYDLRTHKSKALPQIKGCYETGIWRDATKQILCKTYPDGEEYFLVSLDGKDKQYIDFKDKDPIYYLPEYDLLLLSAIELGIFSNYSPEMYVIYVHNLKTQEQHKIASDIRLLDFVWYPTSEKSQ